MKNTLIAYTAFLFYSALKLTWRIRIIEPESFKASYKSGRSLVFAHWHGDELGIVHLLGPYRAAAMVSTSKDGEIMDKVARLFGAVTSRGSSTRGGVSALKGILRLAKDGRHPSIAVDGPKGPLHKVKPGVFEISKLIDGEIFPVVAVADKKHIFERAWNKTFLPLPFATLVVVWGEPLPAVDRQADSRDPELARRLEQALANAKQQAWDLIATL
ncbi:MAG: lysophospholipid acyltransferase family protein [Bdellovibrionota bacterium]